MTDDREKEKDWIRRWPKEKLQVMEAIYTSYFQNLWRTAFNILKDTGLAEDIVQEVMLKIWQMESLDHINTSLGGYLHRATLNKTLNKVRESKRWTEDEPDDVPASFHSSDQLMAGERLEVRFHQVLLSLPERCRLVFILAREEQLSNKEIAELMEISVKTVENQMTKALKILRERITIAP
jgi:RNA polymerase sigma-70 factor (ECF subfamily)